MAGNALYGTRATPIGPYARAMDAYLNGSHSANHTLTGYFNAVEDARLNRQRALLHVLTGG